MADETKTKAQIEADQAKTDRTDNRAMWIASAAIVVLIGGMMGAKMLFGSGNTITPPAGEISSQSRTAAPQ